MGHPSPSTAGRVARISRLAAFLIAVAVLVGCSQGGAPKAQATPRSETGTIGKASFEIDVPAHWNGTLFLYSHGYVAPGGINGAQAAADDFALRWLLDHDYAAAGSSYSSTGWALEDAFRDQIALLDYFSKHAGKPKRVIAWNAELDSAYAFKTLLAPRSALQLTHVTDAAANLQLAQQQFSAASATKQGQARLALVAALVDLPGWFDPRSPEPASGDYAAQLGAQMQWESRVDFNFAFSYRKELEARAGGNPSWNVGVDYAALLARSPDRAEVNALYAQAGLDLRKDLRTLNAGATIKADPAAARYLDDNISFDGTISVPVLSVHTTGDGLVVPPNESAYATDVTHAGNSALLRQLFVHRAGHCAFSPGEIVASVQALLRRVDGGVWDDAALRPGALDDAATALGPSASQFFGFTLDPW